MCDTRGDWNAKGRGKRKTKKKNVVWNMRNKRYRERRQENRVWDPSAREKQEQHTLQQTRENK